MVLFYVLLEASANLRCEMSMDDDASFLGLI
jgi:hypothetical protein